MNKTIAGHLEKLGEEGNNTDGPRAIGMWSQKVSAFLRSALGPSEAEAFEKLQDMDPWKQHALRVGHIQGLVAKAQAQEMTMPAIPTSPVAASTPAFSPLLTPNSRKVFVVHGHDNEAKETAARFLERLGLQPIILHEQPSSGRTIIENSKTIRMTLHSRWFCLPQMT